MFDVVRRWLRASGFAVTYVRNITDIDDKIIKRAAENGESIADLTARFIGFMDEDAAALGVEKPDFEPRATQHRPRMLRIIEMLIRKGLAYRADNGDVYYAVREFAGYGKLSGKSLEDLRAGERVEVDLAKRDPLDFVLWKAAKPGEPAWESPWGPGRPGWHIECSAMSEALLGEHFDIHGGGQDLIFPHHENEIAQSEGAHGHTFVNYWMHNGFVRVDNEKMSKSLGNFFTVREVLAKYDPEVVRFFIVRAHYRSPLNYSDQHLDDARAALARLYTALRDTPPATRRHRLEQPLRGALSRRDERRFQHGGSERRAVRTGERGQSHPRRGGCRPAQGAGGRAGPAAARPVGVSSGRGDWRASCRPSASRRSSQPVRPRAEAKNFAEADRIRKELEDAEVVLEDSAKGTIWRRK